MSMDKVGHAAAAHSPLKILLNRPKIVQPTYKYCSTNLQILLNRPKNIAYLT